MSKDTLVTIAVILAIATFLAAYAGFLKRVGEDRDRADRAGCMKLYSLAHTATDSAAVNLARPYWNSPVCGEQR